MLRTESNNNKIVKFPSVQTLLTFPTPPIIDLSPVTFAPTLDYEQSPAQFWSPGTCRAPEHRTPAPRTHAHCEHVRTPILCVHSHMFAETNTTMETRNEASFPETIDDQTHGIVLLHLLSHFVWESNTLYIFITSVFEQLVYFYMIITCIDLCAGKGPAQTG